MIYHQYLVDISILNHELNKINLKEILHYD